MDWSLLFKNLEEIVASVPSLSIADWTVSINGVRKGPVTEGKVGLNNITTLWAHIVFAVNGISHTIEGYRPLAGGTAVVHFDGQTAHLARMTTRKHVIFNFPPKVRVEVDFVLQNGDRYRFDGTITP